MTNNTLVEAIDDLRGNPICDSIATRIRDIAERHGVTELPSGGPSTNAYAPFSRATADSVGDWGGQEDDVAEMHNAILDQLYELVDIRSTGGGNYVTHYNRQSAEWESFAEQAREAIDDFVCHDFWNLFCDYANEQLPEAASREANG